MVLVQGRRHMCSPAVCMVHRGWHGAPAALSPRKECSGLQGPPRPRKGHCRRPPPAAATAHLRLRLQQAVQQGHCIRDVALKLCLAKNGHSAGVPKARLTCWQLRPVCALEQLIGRVWGARLKPRREWRLAPLFGRLAMRWRGLASDVDRGARSRADLPVRRAGTRAAHTRLLPTRLPPPPRAAALAASLPPLVCPRAAAALPTSTQRARSC